MITSIFNIVFTIFDFIPVQVCCAMSLTISLFGLIRRFVIGDFSFLR